MKNNQKKKKKMSNSARVRILISKSSENAPECPQTADEWIQIARTKDKRIIIGDIAVSIPT